MYKEITLQTTEGEKAFPMLANGATSIRYRQVFHSDLMVGITKYIQFDKNPDSVDIDLTAKLAYIMNAAAECRDMNTLSEGDFFVWLEQFEATALWLANGEIVDVYMGTKETESSEKK